MKRRTVPLHPRPRPWWRRRGVLAAAGAVAALAVLAGVLSATREDGVPVLGGDDRAGREKFPPTRAEPAPYDGRSPRLPAGGERQRVVVALARPSLGERAAQRERRGLRPLTPTGQRRYVRSLADEARSLRSALAARGVALTRVTAFQRVFNGFAADVRTRDLPALTARGLRSRPVRRFFPAGGEPAGPAPAPARRIRSGTPVIALLDTGARPRGSVEAGPDLIDGDADPRPAGEAERHGSRLAALLAARGARVRVTRVAGVQPGERGLAEVYGTTDTLLGGLERTVDPDRDGDTEDGFPVALLGVASPYASFAGTPEAEAADAASALGTLVVAPAGNDGPSEGPHGILAAPAQARGAVSVAARTRPGAVPRAVLAIDDGPRVEDAAVLGGPSPDPKRMRLGRAGMAVVRARGNPAAAAAVAAARGAAAVVVADPREEAILPALPAGRLSVPVLGVTGEAAEAVLEAETGSGARIGRVRSPGAAGARRLAPTASRGPALNGAAKPDVEAPGDAAGLAGSSVAAATVALRAAALLRAEPDLPPGPLRERLASPRADPRLPAAPPPRIGRTELVRRGGQVQGVRFALGRFTRGDVPLGAPTRLDPVDRLELTLETADGRRARRLTPPGGARELLPATYEYTIPPAELRRLGAGRYAFALRAWAPRNPRKPATARSAPFDVR